MEKKNPRLVEAKPWGTQDKSVPAGEQLLFGGRFIQILIPGSRIPTDR